ncbi:putative membrane protein YeaQ/YmgE (transglycosylase-associated protein family) [Gordonia hydrophobica]|nr:putative membrane protein YeaQ/YmgE (transglycosylase-associated protein family) [Gordonia hydrophobica]
MFLRSGDDVVVVAWNHQSTTVEVLMNTLVADEILARSTMTTSVGWIAYLVIGAIAGFIAGKIVKGSGQGFFMNIVIGVIGALLGGFILSFFLDTAGGGWWFTLFTAILGSVILLWIVGKVQGATSRS